MTRCPSPATRDLPPATELQMATMEEKTSTCDQSSISSRLTSATSSQVADRSPLPAASRQRRSQPTRTLHKSRHSKNCDKQARRHQNPAETLQETHEAATPTRSNSPFDQSTTEDRGAAAPTKPYPEHCQAGLPRPVHHQGTKVGPREQTAARTSDDTGGPAQQHRPSRSPSKGRRQLFAPEPMPSVRRYPFRTT